MSREDYVTLKSGGRQKSIGTSMLMRSDVFVGRHEMSSNLAQEIDRIALTAKAAKGHVYFAMVSPSPGSTWSAQEWLNCYGERPIGFAH